MQSRTMRDGVNIRLPNGMRDKLHTLAKTNRRSMNAEIVYHLEQVLQEKCGVAEAATSPRQVPSNPSTGLSNEPSAN